MDKKYYVGIVIVVLLIMFMVPKYFNGNVSASGVEISGDIERVEIIHFHGAKQCSSCIAVGALAEETVNTYFANELKSGKVVFEHVNAELVENREKAVKYGVTGSSLWIGTYYEDGSFVKEQDVNVWYKIKDEQDYMNYLKGVIESKLSEN